MPEYAISELGRELRQSEIISDLTQIRFFDPTTKENVFTRHSFAIILSQDCDLAQDFEKRAKGDETGLNCVLLFEASPLDKIQLPGGDVLRRIRNHQAERYHLLNAVPLDLDLLGQGVPELIIDFKRPFAIIPGEIQRQCAADGGASARRRCRLESPFREHLQTRMAYFLQRVALPDAK